MRLSVSRRREAQEHHRPGKGIQSSSRPWGYRAGSAGQKHNGLWKRRRSNGRCRVSGRRLVLRMVQPRASHTGSASGSHVSAYDTRDRTVSATIGTRPSPVRIDATPSRAGQSGRTAGDPRSAAAAAFNAHTRRLTTRRWTRKSSCCRGAARHHSSSTPRFERLSGL